MRFAKCDLRFAHHCKLPTLWSAPRCNAGWEWDVTVGRRTGVGRGFESSLRGCYITIFNQLLHNCTPDNRQNLVPVIGAKSGRQRRVRKVRLPSITVPAGDQETKMSVVSHPYVAELREGDADFDAERNFCRRPPAAYRRRLRH